MNTRQGRGYVNGAPPGQYRRRGRINVNGTSRSYNGRGSYNAIGIPPGSYNGRENSRANRISPEMYGTLRESYNGRSNANVIPPGPHRKGRDNVNGFSPGQYSIPHVQNTNQVLAAYNSEETQFSTDRGTLNFSQVASLSGTQRRDLHPNVSLQHPVNDQFNSSSINSNSQNSKLRNSHRREEPRDLHPNISLQHPVNDQFNSSSINSNSQNSKLCNSHRREEPRQLNNEALKGRRMPCRPGTGQLGRPIEVKINYFPLSIPHGNVYHYDVEICRERDLQRKISQKGKGPNISTCRWVMEALFKAYKEVSDYCPAFDGKKNLITRRELPLSKRQEFKVTLTDESDRSDCYIVKIQAVKSENEEHIINLDDLHKYIAGETENMPLRAIQALDIIMRHIPSLRLTPVGRSLFHRPTDDELHPLGGGREIWFGYYQSVRPTQWKMMVNIDKATTVFYESQSVLALVGKILNKNHLEIHRFSPYDIKNLTKEMKGLKIKVTHQTFARKYRIFQVTSSPLSELTFPFTENEVTRNIKVTDYFNQHYKINLNFAHLSGLDVGDKGKPKYLPMEVCQIVEGQHCKKKLSEKQTADMIKFTAIKPQARFKEIEDNAKKTVEYNAAYMEEFGLQMNTKCVQATARILDPPFVLYKNKNEIQPENGVWDMKRKKFFKGVKINNWGLISMCNPKFCKQDHLEKFSSMLLQAANSLGIDMNPVADIKVLRQKEDITEVLKEFAKCYQLDLVVIVLPDRNSSGAYSDIKQMAETQIGLKTQCIKETNIVKKCSPALVSNLCQKINAKMGGINCGLSDFSRPEILNKPVIFIGADVTHPSPGDKTSVSIAAVVGSLDRHPSRYAALTRIQLSNNDKTARRIEIIQDLKEIVKELLKKFYQSTSYKPEKIIFYRDGVSEGEFQKVQEEEITKIRDACTELEDGYQPGITFIVVGKRHHMRMMPVHSKEGVGSAKNVPPGTTLDVAVVHPTDFDFFLCSHFGIQGTSRPAHYTVLWDDNEFSADELQKLSYYLCHVYARCTRSISIPSPVQYAHLAAARAKHHLISGMEGSTKSSDSSDGQELLTDSMMQSINVVRDFITSMYFV